MSEEKSLETEAKVEDDKILIRAVSKLEARVLVFLAVFSGFLYALANGHINSQQFITLMALDGLLYKIWEKQS